MIELKPIEKLAEKQKWLKRFCKAYSGGLGAVTDALFGPLTKYFVAIEDGKELGFIRISDYSSCRATFPGEKVWSISDAYVKPPSRKKGVLRRMLTQVVRDHHVKMLFIEKERFFKNSVYYSTLGFTDVLPVGDGSMVYVEINSAPTAQAASNDAIYKLYA